MVSKKSAKKTTAKKSAKKSTKKAATKTPAPPAPQPPGGAGDESAKPLHLVNVDLAKVWDGVDKGKQFITVLGWGDEVVVLNADAVESGQAEFVEVKATKFTDQPGLSTKKPETVTGFILPGKGRKASDLVVRRELSRILKVDFVDVQQGDGSVIITPGDRKTILIDGGDNQMFARYLANRFNRFGRTSAEEPRKVDCIVVTHGDADHFDGLVRIHDSESEERLEETPYKRLFIYPERVYHNGLVKRPSSVEETQMLGASEEVTDSSTGRKMRVITGLEENLLKVDPKEMNAPFKKWREALDDYNKRCREKTGEEIKFRRLEIGTDDAFDFLKEDGITAEVLAPIPTETSSARGLKFLGAPPKGPRVGDEVLDTHEEIFKGDDVAHTINGHSIVFRLKYGNFSFLFTGDLNDEAERRLTRERRGDLRAEVFKVPHHGSADFSGAFLSAVEPLVSVVSSGDESSRKEYVHPRATLMGALGKFGRGNEPLVFVTELVAFFEVVGPTSPEWHKMDKDELAKDLDGKVPVFLTEKRGQNFFAFQRAAFGLVRVRTDGQRLLVYTDSGQSTLKESYAFKAGPDGEPVPTQVVQV
ncbi:MAG TPA: MBL fold metallo-hydrolase [Pyrinomonadaceae bacterium]|jgi:beta-lactamase superfamily II metal-dependent hydrolase|nr:MBL fold metallo-hydrolase [Pyrinomonadaceae bacterium]